MNQRYYILDLIRGFAVVLMVIFHFCYDLDVLKLHDFDMRSTFWHYFPRLIVFLFLFCVGVSQKISYSTPLEWKKIFKRVRQMAFFALLISLGTYFLFPKNWIYFGTLHCIAVISLLGPWFLEKPILSWGIISLFPTSYLFFDLSLEKLSLMPEITSMDYIPLYPWLWVTLLGQQMAKLILKIKLNPNKLFSLLEYLGKHSLKVYLLHQVILFSFLWLIAKFI